LIVSGHCVNRRNNRQPIKLSAPQAWVVISKSERLNPGVTKPPKDKTPQLATSEKHERILVWIGNLIECSALTFQRVSNRFRAELPYNLVKPLAGIIFGEYSEVVHVALFEMST
jgi:hypothetical protein